MVRHAEEKLHYMHAQLLRLFVTPLKAELDQEPQKKRQARNLVVGPCVAYCLCSRVGSVAVAVPAPTICFAPLSIVTTDMLKDLQSCEMYILLLAISILYVRTRLR